MVVPKKLEEQNCPIEHPKTEEWFSFVSKALDEILEENLLSKNVIFSVVIKTPTQILLTPNIAFLRIDARHQIMHSCA